MSSGRLPNTSVRFKIKTLSIISGEAKDDLLHNQASVPGDGINTEATANNGGTRIDFSKKERLSVNSVSGVRFPSLTLHATQTFTTGC